MVWQTRAGRDQLPTMLPLKYWWSVRKTRCRPGPSRANSFTGGAEAQRMLQLGVAIDPCNNTIYVCDHHNHRILACRLDPD